MFSTKLAGLAAAIATLFGLGRIRPAPGTVASFVTLIAAWEIAGLGGRMAVLLFALAAIAIGTWAADVYARERAMHDPSDCVVDELAGQCVACAFAPRTLMAYALAFALFRALDILKPWPISAAERLPGGFGIMADDVLAGLIAGLLIMAFVQTGVLRG